MTLFNCRTNREFSEMLIPPFDIYIGKERYVQGKKDRL